jgi:hypothetical protein
MAQVVAIKESNSEYFVGNIRQILIRKIENIYRLY